MRRNMKKAAALLLVALIVTAMAPSSVFASSVVWPTEAFQTSQTVYMKPTPHNGLTYVNLSLGDLAKSKTITNVKSSNTAILQPNNLYRSTSRITNTNLAANNVSNTYSSSAGYIEVLVKKAGTAAISFKAGNKKYSCKVKVLPYTNPVKSLKFTGIGTTNLKSLFKKYAVNDKGYAMKANAKAGFVQVAAASGWKIKSAEFTTIKPNHSYSFTCWNLKQAPSSVKMWIPSVKKGVGLVFNMTFVNTRTGGELLLQSRMK